MYFGQKSPSSAFGCPSQIFGCVGRFFGQIGDSFDQITHDQLVHLCYSGAGLSVELVLGKWARDQGQIAKPTHQIEVEMGAQKFGLSNQTFAQGFVHDRNLGDAVDGYIGPKNSLIMPTPGASNVFWETGIPAEIVKGRKALRIGRKTTFNGVIGHDVGHGQPRQRGQIPIPQRVVGGIHRPNGVVFGLEIVIGIDDTLWFYFQKIPVLARIGEHKNQHHACRHPKEILIAHEF